MNRHDLTSSGHVPSSRKCVHGHEWNASLANAFGFFWWSHLLNYRLQLHNRSDLSWNQSSPASGCGGASLLLCTTKVKGLRFRLKVLCFLLLPCSPVGWNTTRQGSFPFLSCSGSNYSESDSSQTVKSACCNWKSSVRSSIQNQLLKTIT